MNTASAIGHGVAPRHAAPAYGLLGLPLAFVALPVYVHLPNVYAQQYGVPLAALGGVLLLSRSVDAVVDPWLGRWGDRLYRHSWRAVWLTAVLLALAVALGFAALFFPPAATLSPTGLLVWVGAALTLSHLAYSGLGILHQAWAARQGGGGVAQSRWVAWREGFALVGVLLASALPALWGWTLTTALLVFMLALGLLSWQRTAQHAASLAATPAGRVAHAHAHADGTRGVQTDGAAVLRSDARATHAIKSRTRVCELNQCRKANAAVNAFGAQRLLLFAQFWVIHQGQ